MAQKKEKMKTNDSGAYCASGGCGKKETYDWMSKMGISDVDGFDLVEVSFKQGVHKEFVHNPAYLQAVTGDMVVVDVGSGHDIGKITLSGEMVKLQIHKKRVKNTTEFGKVVRLADKRDLSKLEQARSIEIQTMIRSRAIVNSLGLDMKIGDVRYQGDLRQATFYYIANGRVDFRELIKVYAREFKIRVKMRQVGARQESALIGGLGSCGRELCCSTWLTDLKSVSTAAARYQNLSFNQTKLSGQCGRLKCCLNFELDYYVEALREFPKNARKLKTGAGVARLVKTDIFRKLMFFSYESERGRGKLYAITAKKAKEIVAMNRKGEEPANLVDLQVMINLPKEEDQWDYENVGQVVELPPEERKRRRKNNRRKGNSRRKPGQNKGARPNSNKPKPSGKPKAKGPQKAKPKTGQKPKPGTQKPKTKGQKPQDKTNKPKSNPNKPNPNKKRRPQKRKPKTEQPPKKD